MLIPRSLHIHLATQPVDFRKAIDGLAALVQNALGGDPLAGHLWVFHSKDRRALKMLLWDTGGFLLLHKRLEKGRFRLPPREGNSVRLTAAELTALLEGIDLSGATRLPRWNPPERSPPAGAQAMVQSPHGSHRAPRYPPPQRGIPR